MPKAGAPSAAVTAAAKSPDNNKYLKSSDDTALEGHLTLIGQMNSGKTTMAATVSQLWPAEVPAKKKIHLEDLLWISFDRGGTAGFATLKVNVPYLIDAREIIGDKGVEAGIETIIELAKKVLDQHPSFANIALDTISKLDALMAEHYKRVHANDSNRFRWSDACLVRHGRLYNSIDKLNRRIVTTFHTNAILMDASDDQRKSRVAMAIAGEDVDMKHDITGKSRKLYLSDASLKGAIWCKVDKREGTKRIYLPYGGKQMEGGCRYHELLDEEEEPNFQMVFGKIKAGLK